jgi:hypothetical protein
MSSQQKLVYVSDQLVDFLNRCVFDSTYYDTPAEFIQLLANKNLGSPSLLLELLHMYVKYQHLDLGSEKGHFITDDLLNAIFGHGTNLFWSLRGNLISVPEKSEDRRIVEHIKRQHLSALEYLVPEDFRKYQYPTINTGHLIRLISLFMIPEQLLTDEQLKELQKPENLALDRRALQKANIFMSEHT